MSQIYRSNQSEVNKILLFSFFPSLNTVLALSSVLKMRTHYIRIFAGLGNAWNVGNVHLTWLLAHDFKLILQGIVFNLHVLQFLVLLIVLESQVFHVLDQIVEFILVFVLLFMKLAFNHAFLVFIVALDRLDLVFQVTILIFILWHLSLKFIDFGFRNFDFFLSLLVFLEKVFHFLF